MLLLSVDSHKKLSMRKIIECICCTGKQVAFITSDYICLRSSSSPHRFLYFAEFWTSKCSQRYIVIHSSSLQGCSVYLFFFGILFSFGRTLSQDFYKAARWSLQSFCEACVSLWPSAFSEGLLPRENASGILLPCWATRSETLQPRSICIS